MQVRAFSPLQRQRSFTTSSKSIQPSQNEVPQEQRKSSSEIVNNLKLGAVAVGCGGLGYLGGVAHNIPYIGPTISGVAGAVVGASAGAAAASALPGQRIKAGALLGAVGGAILGATGGGTLAGNVAMGVAGATAPYGLLLAVFSGAS